MGYSLADRRRARLPSGLRCRPPPVDSPGGHRSRALGACRAVEAGIPVGRRRRRGDRERKRSGGPVQAGVRCGVCCRVCVLDAAWRRLCGRGPGWRQAVAAPRGRRSCPQAMSPPGAPAAQPVAWSNDLLRSFPFDAIRPAQAAFAGGSAGGGTGRRPQEGSAGGPARILRRRGPRGHRGRKGPGALRAARLRPQADRAQRARGQLPRGTGRHLRGRNRRGARRRPGDLLRPRRVARPWSSPPRTAACAPSTRPAPW